MRDVSNTATVYMVQLPKCKFNVSSKTKCILDNVIMTSTLLHCDHVYGLCERCWGTSCCLLGNTVSSVVSVNAMTGFHIFTPCWTWRDTRMMIQSRTSQVTSKCINPIISSLIQALTWSNAIAHPALTMDYMSNGAIHKRSNFSLCTNYVTMYLALLPIRWLSKHFKV